MARLLIVEDNHELASLMAAAAEARGHGVQVAHTGRAALGLVRAGGIEAAVVDLLLPDMRGSEVLAALKALGTPALAVSGVYKGERFAREAVEVHGAAGFFEKPFDLERLLEALEERCGTARPPATPAPVPADDDEEVVLALEELALLPEEATGEPDAEGGGAAGAPLAELRLPFAEREKVWGQPGAPAGARRQLPGWSLSGDLERTSVPRLLNAYYEARHSGELELRRGPARKLVAFEAGRPVFAASNLAHERFAHFCVRRGALPSERLEEVATLVREGGLRTGEAMERLGLLEASARHRLLEAQVKEIIWSTFAWAEGAYAFRPTRPRRRERVPLSLFPGDLILEGVLRTETLVGLRASVPAARRLFPTADPPYGLNELALSGAQALLLAYADGSKTVEDLVALSDLSEREALGTLRAFELMGLLEERPDAPTGGRRISFGL